MGKVLQFPRKPQQPPTFQEFGGCLRRRDVPGAAALLSRLFGISEPRALGATTFLLQRIAADPSILDDLRFRLRDSVVSGRTNSALTMLIENFGLGGPEAIHVLGNLGKLFSPGQTTI